MYAIEDFFDRTVKKQMYKGIEATLEAKAHNTCALALVVYTEIMGGFIRGTHERGQGTKNFYEFLKKYFGENYKQLDQNIDLYGRIRSGLVHEGEPKGEFGIIISGKLEKRKGIEFRKIGENRQLVNFSLREYFEEFKEAVEKYRKDLEQACSLYQKCSDQQIMPNEETHHKIKLLKNFLSERNRKYDEIFSKFTEKV